MALTGAEKARRHRARARRRERIYPAPLDDWTIERLVAKGLIDADRIFDFDYIGAVVAAITKKTAVE